MTSRPVASTRIEIDAPIEIVWAAMLDLPRYREWNPFVVDVRHAPPVVQVGTRFLLHVRWDSGKELDSWETVTRIDPPCAAHRPASAVLEYRYSAWLAVCGLVRATRAQRLTQSADGPTRYETEEVFSGLLTRFLPLREVQDGFERQALALKQRAEMQAGQR